MSQLLLAVDTSGKNGSITLAQAASGRGEVEVLEVAPLTGGAFSSELVPRIAALLERHGRGKGDLGALVVASGPGSFTGLRVGLAAVKALSEALQKPIVSVSLLEAVAWGGASGGRVLAALDAGRGDLYVGDYELGGAVPLMHSERLFSREEFLRLAVGMIVVTPDARLVELARGAGIRCTQIDNPDAGAIARLGWKHLERGETVRAEDLEANYIRRSDAEIFAKPSP